MFPRLVASRIRVSTSTVPVLYPISKSLLSCFSHVRQAGTTGRLCYTVDVTFVRHLQRRNASPLSVDGRPSHRLSPAVMQPLTVFPSPQARRSGTGFRRRRGWVEGSAADKLRRKFPASCSLEYTVRTYCAQYDGSRKRIDGPEMAAVYFCQLLRRPPALRWHGRKRAGT